MAYTEISYEHRPVYAFSAPCGYWLVV